MEKLLNVKPGRPVTFSTQTDLEGLFTGLPIGRTHNVGINWDLGYATAVGAQPRNSTCRSGIIYIDISDPTNTSTPGCAAQDGYIHDIQCWKYNGPDKKYNGRDLCFGFNKDTVTLYDSTSKTGINASKIISKIGYEGATYTHQGWFVDNDYHQYLLVDDELDEIEGIGPGASGRPVTHIIAMTDLEDPKPTGYFYATDVNAIDHNQYVVDSLTYQSNYRAGL
jgi:choice-of-anchor B domain-containing protein